MMGCSECSDQGGECRYPSPPGGAAQSGAWLTTQPAYPRKRMCSRPPQPPTTAIAIQTHRRTGLPEEKKPEKKKSTASFAPAVWAAPECGLEFLQRALDRSGQVGSWVLHLRSALQVTVGITDHVVASNARQHVFASTFTELWKGFSCALVVILIAWMARLCAE